jgi:hypothetical protein
MRPINANNFWKDFKETSTIRQHPTTSNKNVLIVPCPNSLLTFLGVFLEIRSLGYLQRYKIMGRGTFRWGYHGKAGKINPVVNWIAFSLCSLASVITNFFCIPIVIETDKRCTIFKDNSAYCLPGTYQGEEQYPQVINPLDLVPFLRNLEHKPSVPM